MNNEQNAKHLKGIRLSMQKTYMLIAAAIVILIAVIISMIVSSSKKNDMDFDWTANQQEIIEINKDNSTFKSAGKIVQFTATDIEFFKNENVDVKYYFFGKDKAMSKIVYDVSACDKQNVNEMIKHLNNSYECVKNTENTINGSTKRQIRWTNDDMNIFYEKLVTAGTESTDGIVTMKFTFIPTKDK